MATEAKTSHKTWLEVVLSATNEDFSALPIFDLKKLREFVCCSPFPVPGLDCIMFFGPCKVNSCKFRNEVNNNLFRWLACVSLELHSAFRRRELISTDVSYQTTLSVTWELSIQYHAVYNTVIGCHKSQSRNGSLRRS